MTINEKERFYELFTELCESKNRKFAEAKFKIWVKYLSKYSLSKIEPIIQNAITSGTKGLPQLGNIIESIEGFSHDQRYFQGSPDFPFILKRRELTDEELSMNPEDINWAQLTQREKKYIEKIHDIKINNLLNYEEKLNQIRSLCPYRFCVSCFRTELEAYLVWSKQRDDFICNICTYTK